MKALTVCQPYAELICRHTKRVENRVWSTSFRGWFYLHAGKSRAWFDDDEQLIRELGSMPPFGAVAAIAELVDYHHISKIAASEYDHIYPWLRDHAHTNGPWCWVIGEVHRVGPWPWRGGRRLFEINNAQFEAEALRLVA